MRSDIVSFVFLVHGEHNLLFCLLCFHCIDHLAGSIPKLVVTLPIARLCISALHCLSAYRGVHLFNKMHVPVLGMVENMSYHQCKACGHKEHTFGEGGVGRMAAEFGVDVLAEVRRL